MTTETPSTETFTGLSEQEWLDLRSEDLTSTEVAALFGLSPYETVFELYHRKAGNIPSLFEANERTIAGQFLEPAIARLLAHQEGLEIEELKGVYARLPAERAGASFDYKIVGGQVPEGFDGPGLFEIKNVDYGRFKEGWDPYAETLQAPLHIELQLQWQLMVSGLSWGAIGVLIGGNDARITYRYADPDTHAKLRAAAADFWAALAEGREPSPDYQRDGEVLKALFQRSDPRAALPAEVHARAMDAAAREIAASAEMSSAKEIKDAARAELMHLMGEVEEAILPDGTKILWRTQKNGQRPMRLTPPKAPVQQAA